MNLQTSHIAFPTGSRQSAFVCRSRTLRRKAPGSSSYDTGAFILDRLIHELGCDG